MSHSPSSVLGRIPSGLYILTARHGDQETGMLASWVMQAGFEPPTVSVAIGRGRYIAEWLSAGSPFVLHVLSEKQKGLLKHFGRGFEAGEAAFTGLDCQRSTRGVPVLIDTLGHLECVPTGHADSGDHRIFLGEVISGTLTAEDPPTVHIRKSGLRY